MTDQHTPGSPTATALAEVGEIAFVGLGRMGTVMARRLAEAGASLSVWNRTTSRCDPLTEVGATLLPSLPAAAGADLVFSMVADDDALAALHDPDRGLFSDDPAERRVRTWVDGSTVSPEAATRAAEAAAAVGVSYVSAPVSGSPGVVEAGNAIFAVSGDPAGLDHATPVCAAMGRAVHRVGEGATANVVKLCTNALLGVTMQSLAEIAVLGDRHGVARAALLGFVNDSAIGSAFSRYKTPPLVELEFPVAFTPEGQRKDLRLALDLARQAEVPMPVLSETEVAYSRLISGGLGAGRDFASLVLNVARDAGVELVPERDEPSA
jgi:3-hydroxyisobutyrate dehydrogenase